MAEPDTRPTPAPTTAPTTPAEPAGSGGSGEDDRFSYHDADREQAEFEALLEEKGDFQEAVDADRRGEEPSGSAGSTMP